jgi:hypothetical protein
MLAVAHAGPICGKRHREEERPQASPSGKGNNSGGKGNNGSNARPAKPKPDKYLDRLQAVYRAEELKARIRAHRMMSQGILFSQVAPTQVPAYVAATSAPARAPAPAPAQAPALALAPVQCVNQADLTLDEAIAIFQETIERLRLQ